MLVTRFPLLAAGSLALLLQACASAPPISETPTVSKPIPELTLNLPDQATGTCPCTPETGVDHTFLDKGFRALVAGDHKEAVNYFRRYQRLETSPASNWEAEIAVAYDKMLPDSPYYNWRAARESYLRLMRIHPKGVKLHDQVILMREALAILSNLHTQINDLQKESATLSESLEKREEALRRLRELTLGQRGAAP